MSYAEDHPGYIDASAEENDGWRWYGVEALGISAGFASELRGIGIGLINDLAAWRAAVGSFDGVGSRTRVLTLEAAWINFEDMLASERRS